MNSTEKLYKTTTQPEVTDKTSTKFEEKEGSEDQGSTVQSNSTKITDSTLNTTKIHLNTTDIHKVGGNVSKTEEVYGSRNVSAKNSSSSAIQHKEVNATTPVPIDIKKPVFQYSIIPILILGFLMVGFTISFALRTMRKRNHAERETELRDIESVYNLF